MTYNVDGWIDKNKDPLNDNVIELLQKSTVSFIAEIWTDRKALIGEFERSAIRHQCSLLADRRKKGTQFVTVGQLHKVCEAHIRTIISCNRNN